MLAFLLQLANVRTDELHEFKVVVFSGRIIKLEWHFGKNIFQIIFLYRKRVAWYVNCVTVVEIF